MVRTLEWVTSLLQANKGHFSIVLGHPSPSPKIMISMQHHQWGNCVVHVAQDEGATVLRNELSAIRRCHDLGHKEKVPEVLHWEDKGSLVAYAVPQYGNPVQLSLEKAAGIIAPIHFATGRRARLSNTPALDTIQNWHTQMRESQTVISQVLSLGSQLDAWLLLGMVHRDFWWDNILTNGETPVIIDWEYSEADYPAVFDLFEYYVWLGDTVQSRMERISRMVESPEVAIPNDLRPDYVETSESQALRIIVGLWLADYTKIRSELAEKTGLLDPYKLEGWSWLSHWSSVVSGHRCA